MPNLTYASPSPALASSALPRCHSGGVRSSTRGYHAGVAAAWRALRAFIVLCCGFLEESCTFKSLLKSSLQQWCLHEYGFFIGNLYKWKLNGDGIESSSSLMHRPCIPVQGCGKQDQDPCSDSVLDQLTCPWPSRPTCGEVPARGGLPAAEQGHGDSLSWGMQQDRARPINPPSKYPIHRTNSQQELSPGPRWAGAVKTPGVSI